MDPVLALRFLHVTLAIVWLGGGFALVLAGLPLRRKARAGDMMALLRIVAFLGRRLFLPASLATLASGIGLVLLGSYGWPAWVVLALAGVAFTAGFGALVLGPGAEAALKTADQHGAQAALPAAERLFRLAKLDHAVQFGIVFLMVVKPGWGETALVAGLATVVALAVLAAFRPMPRVA